MTDLCLGQKSCIMPFLVSADPRTSLLGDVNGSLILPL